MPKPERDITDRNPLTPQEAADLAFELVGGGESDDVAQLLLLCHAFTYEQNWTLRESMMGAVEERLAVSVAGHDALQHEAMRRQADALRQRAERKGGRQ